MAFTTIVLRPLAIRLPNAQFQVTAVIFTGIYLLCLPILFLISNVYLADLWHWLPLLVLIGVALGIQGVVNFWMLRYMDAAVSSLVGLLGIVSTVILATILLGEGLTPLQFLGAVLIIGAIGSVFMVGVSPKQRHDWTRGLLLGIASAVLLAIGATAEKYLLGQMEFGSYLVWGGALQWITILAVSFVYNAKQYKKVLQPKNAKLISIVVILRTVMVLMFTASLLIIDNLSKLMVLCGLKVILAALLGVVILRERQFIKQKLAAAVVAALGTALIFW